MKILGPETRFLQQYQRPQEKIPFVGWVQRSETQQNRWIMLPLMLGCATLDPTYDRAQALVLFKKPGF